MALVVASGAALAAPYGISYTGTIWLSDFPEIKNGQSYSVTFVFDNGGNSANSQIWTGAQLTCTIWRMNDAGNAVYAQNLAATPPTVANGSVTTNASGALASMFTVVKGEGVAAGQYTASGLAFSAPVYWFANEINSVINDSLLGGFSDSSGGVQMNIASWSKPVPYSSGCSTTTGPAAATATTAAVPTLNAGALALLASLLGLGAAGVLRRRGRSGC